MIDYVNRQQEIYFKDTRIRPMLRVITLLACEYCYYKFGKKLWIFSTYREDDDGVHKYWRGVDADNNELSHEQLREIETYLNWLYIYDPSRPKMKVCLFHTEDPEGKKGWHLHLQVHPNTRMSEPAI